MRRPAPAGAPGLALSILRRNLRASAGAGAKHPGAAAEAPAGREGATAEERIAEAITRFTGSMRFVYLHLALFGFWIVANLGWVPASPLGSLVCRPGNDGVVEAIFLSTFVLISQNRMAAAADKRADLDLQVSLSRNTRSPG